MATPEYSIPNEAQALLINGIIHNPLLRSLPAEVVDAAQFISFKGGKNPVVPINWRFAESISAIKGWQGAMINVLNKRRLGLEYQKVEIDVDHATLFVFSLLFAVIDPGLSPQHENVTIYNKPQLYKYIPNGDLYGMFRGSKFQTACTNIYRTKEGKYFHLHGSMNASVSQSALGLPNDIHAETMQDAVSFYAEKIAEYTAPELETLMNDEHRQAGTTCQSPQEYRDSEHGEANAHVGLYELHHIPNEAQKACWWDSVPGHDSNAGTNTVRPLFGLKIVDLSRVIAAPTVTRELAELGASVLRITSPNITDPTDLLIDLGWGKWNAHLDLKTEEGRNQLTELIKEADIFVDGYRPAVLEKYGFGKEGVLKIVEGRSKGIIYVHENCYGWNGPLMGRSGWQQISDAHCGTSYEFGKAIGADGPVTPIFPNSDYCTGAAGAVGVLNALIERAENGGSYVLDVALNYYSQWLVNTVGTYPPPVWDSLWSSYGKPTFNASDSMMQTMVPPTVGLMKEKNGERLFNEEFFEVVQNGAIKKSVRKLKPVLRFVDGRVRLGHHIGFRGNGVDKARWPEDLTTEIVE
ncbi:CoA-transferase family III domain-containing protein [Panaeolus papilionaceus]|nr:CoA-transferase family III domain-containing protein [Panaeolus papilionaceus]